MNGRGEHTGGKGILGAVDDDECSMSVKSVKGDNGSVGVNAISTNENSVVLTNDSTVSVVFENAYMAMLLNNTDVIVDTAISGPEAVEKIKRNRYDLIFIDHLMPGMDGLELKSIIEKMPDNLNKDTPLIMQTANAVVGAKEQYEELGFVDYIAKPIKEEELRKLIRKYMM